MRTFRRRLLDQALLRSVSFMRGRVVDLGGGKYGGRSTFQPPLHKVKAWYCLNTDISVHPDCCGSAECVPLKEVAVDTVIMTEVLEYLSSPQKALNELHRILIPGGIGIISIPFLVPVHGDHWADRVRFTPLKIKEMILAAGFRDLSILPVGSLGAVMHDILYVAFGYAITSKHHTLSRVLRTGLVLFGPLFCLLDAVTGRHKKYITTGYFITVKKSS
jgi:SAM-dependent methyltransferase